MVITRISARAAAFGHGARQIKGKFICLVRPLHVLGGVFAFYCSSVEPVGP